MFEFLSSLFRIATKTVTHSEKFIDAYGVAGDMTLEYANLKADEVRKKRMDAAAALQVIDAQPTEIKKIKAA